MWITVIHLAVPHDLLFHFMDIQVAVLEFLRQNLIGNQANSVFSVQKHGT